MGTDPAINSSTAPRGNGSMQAVGAKPKGGVTARTPSCPAVGRRARSDATYLGPHLTFGAVLRELGQDAQDFVIESPIH